MAFKIDYERDEQDRMLSIVSRCIAHNVYNVSELIALLNEIKKEVEELKGLNKLEKAKEIIKKNYEYAQCGIFHSRNIMGDPMENIYDDDELQIDICRHFEYFEV